MLYPVSNQHGHVQEGVPDGRKRKLALHTFGGEELYHDLASRHSSEVKNVLKSSVM